MGVGILNIATLFSIHTGVFMERTRLPEQKPDLIRSKPIKWKSVATSTKSDLRFGPDKVKGDSYRSRLFDVSAWNEVGYVP
jgi:hypothetical protein